MTLQGLLAFSMVLVVSLRGDVVLLAGLGSDGSDFAGDDRLAVVTFSSSDMVFFDEVEEHEEDSEFGSSTKKGGWWW